MTKQFDLSFWFGLGGLVSLTLWLAPAHSDEQAGPAQLVPVAAKPLSPMPEALTGKSA